MSGDGSAIYIFLALRCNGRAHPEPAPKAERCGYPVRSAHRVGVEVGAAGCTWRYGGAGGGGVRRAQANAKEQKFICNLTYHSATHVIIWEQCEEKSSIKLAEQTLSGPVDLNHLNQEGL
ncbi:hypothetical protein C8J57DRAFT_1244139 [Mycena rebaudengoi]|nr:hypothetical protein C8J57DRAFT_1244139 [Mycena rebaudengoi]